MIGPTEQTGYGEIPNTLLAGIGHTDLTGDMHTPGFGDYPMPGATGEPGMPPSASGGIETDGFGEPLMPPALGDIPITPARYCGDIYATVTAEHVGDSHIPPAIGNMYAGLWAGEMLTGVAPRLSDMETTCIGEVEMPPARLFGDIPMPPGSISHTYTAGEMGMGCFGDIHAGLWAGQMFTGVARRIGDMPTT